MQATDLVLRTLADSGLDGQRSWKNVGDLAHAAGVGEKLAYKVLTRPVSIGAVVRHPGGGFSVTDPERVLMLFSARRSLAGARRTTYEAAQTLIAGLDVYALGGTRAAAHHLGDGVMIADHAEAIVYVPEHTDLSFLSKGEGALVTTADAKSFRSWEDGYTSKAQTYADLFAQPGWQASEFRRALWREWFTVDDWSKAEQEHGGDSGRRGGAPPLRARPPRP